METITLFNTTLSHADTSLVVIPNRRVVGEILHNYGQIRQHHIVVHVAYDADINRVLALTDGIVRANARVLQQPAPLIQVGRLSESAIEINVGPWTKVSDYADASGELNKAIAEALRANAIAVQAPRREVRLVEKAA